MNMYPNNCILCSSETSIADYGYNYICMNMGSGFCSNCEIRYSMSEGIWKCVKQIGDGVMCLQKIDENLCSNPLHSTEYILSKKVMGKVSSYPFKQKIKITVKKAKINTIETNINTK